MIRLINISVLRGSVGRRAVLAHADQVARVPLAAAMDAHGLHSQVRRGAQLADRRVHARRHGLTLGTLVRGRLTGRVGAGR